MSANKYPGIFLRQMEAIVHLISFKRSYLRSGNVIKTSSLWSPVTVLAIV